jgi:hypothetical protein
MEAILRAFYMLGWVLIVGAWADWSLATLYGYDVWKEWFGMNIPPGMWSLTPIMTGCFGIVLIATCRS